MKTIKAQGAMPGIEDTLITYAGSFTGTAHIYKIQTECKTLLHTKITAYPTADVVQGSLIEIPYTISVNTNGYKYAQFTAMPNYTFYYEIAGTEKAAMTNAELSIVSAGTFDWGGHHNHNGRNSPNIDPTNLFAGTANAGKSLVVGQNGYIAYVDAVVDLPTIPTELTLEGEDLVVYEATNGIPLSLAEENFADLDIQWKTDSTLGTGETGSTYSVQIQAKYDDGSAGPGDPLKWHVIKSAASNSAGADAALTNWNASTEANVVIATYPDAPWRVLVIATKTSSGGQTASAYGNFKYD